MKRNSSGMWLVVFAGVLFTLALVVSLNPATGGGVVHLNNAILASDLNSTNVENDGWVATYDAASGGFTWEISPIGAHATTHENTGGDEIDVVGLSGLLADDQHVLDGEVLAVAAAISHNTTHENTGGDEISVADLSGLLADDQHVLDAEVISAVEAGTLSTVDINGGTINGITDLVVIDGGTGAGSFTDHGVMVGSGTGALSVTGTGASGEVLTSNGSGADPTFQVVGGGVTFLTKNAVETVNNSTTLQNDDDLTFSVLANKNYAVWGALLVNSPSNADIKFQWSVPASATLDSIFSTAGGVVESVVESGATNWGTTGSNQTLKFSGIVLIAGSAGTTVIQWAQQTAQPADTYVRAGSWLAYQLLN